TYQYLFSFSQGHLSSLFESAYISLSSAVASHVSTLFSDLSLFIRDASSNISVEAAVHRFYDNLFPLVHTRLINPGAPAAPITDGNNLSDCLRMTRQDVNPFGHHAREMAEDLAEALRAARALTRAFSVGEEVMNGTEVAPLTKECTRALVKMQYCPHCRGLTLIRPCGVYCLNVMRGCLASLAELDMPWRHYVAILEDLTLAVAGEHSLELALLGIRGQVNEAILHAQLHGPRLTATRAVLWGRVLESRVVGPCCGAVLWGRVVGPCCGAELWGRVVGPCFREPCCGAVFESRVVGPCCGAVLWGRVLESRVVGPCFREPCCGAVFEGRVVGPCCGVVLWGRVLESRVVESCCGAVLWGRVLEPSCGAVLWSRVVGPCFREPSCGAVF
ncbi:hypothetical protein NFI96_013358, partial [Prochilodus magdalenae]